MGSIGWGEVLLIFFAVLLLFGTKRLPEVGRSLGKAIREFKRAGRELQEDLSIDLDDEEPVARTESTATKSGGERIGQG